jgi:hypothetical protein
VRIERLIDWIAHDLKRGGHWGQVAGLSALVLSLLAPATMALMWPFEGEIALSTQVSGSEVSINVPRELVRGDALPSSLESRITMSCADKAASKVSGSDMITFSSQNPIGCSDDQQPVARLRTAFSVWDLARMEMGSSVSDDVRE